MFEQTFKNIDDILHKDAGCGSELDYVEQTSWVLFLKYLDDLERDKATAAELKGNYTPLTREQRVAASQATIFALLNEKQKEFIDFVLSKYVETGVDELDQEQLPTLLTNKYHSLEDAKDILGDTANISKLFIEFQQHLYNSKVA
ncbi:MAG: hypothetical protein IPP71_19825 [Bacteroidetes bacterium]|nr:hypothetical protein [Bacteroidota bacterium]